MSGIILYGDSVFFGYGASEKNKGCGRLLKWRLNTPVLIKAKNNATTRDALTNAHIAFGDNNGYTKVVLLFGNNDCRLCSDDTPLVSKSEFKDNLVKLVNLVNQARKKCYICNLQPLNNKQFMRSAVGIVRYMKIIKDPFAWHKSYSDICEKVAAENNVSLVDIRKALSETNKNIFYSDGLHPNDVGHEIIAETLYQALVR